MSTRLSVDLLFLGLIAAIAGWISRAPEDPPARAAYLCAPVAMVAGTAAHLESAMTDDERIAPAEPPWRFDPARACRRVVVRIAQGSAS